MDSFFKAAVSDLDKLLDDFELNSEEPECNPVSLKPSVYPFSSLGPQCSPSEVSSVPPSLPDLNSLHYGLAPSCPDGSGSYNHNHRTDNREVKVQPLTGVDLLSSVDRRSVKNSAPPFPDRALKPVCDLVNDTSSAILVRVNSHDAFSELDMVEKQMEEEEEALLVDFNSPIVGEEQGSARQSQKTQEAQTPVGNGDALLGLDSQSNGYSASLSLLDVILPAAVERSCDPTDPSLSPRSTESADREEGDSKEGDISDQAVENSVEHIDPEPADGSTETRTTQVSKEDESHEVLDECEAESTAGLKFGASHSEPVGLSCLPIAVSMCGALVNPKTIEDDSGQASEQCGDADSSKSTEADSLSGVEDREDGPHSEGPGPHSEGPGPHSEGLGPYSEGPGPHSEGPGPHSEGPGPHSEGPGPHSEGPGPHSEGPGPHSEGPGPHSEGPGPHSEGPGPHSEGPGPYSEGPGPHSEGPGPHSEGPGPHSEGPGPHSEGPGPHSEGPGPHSEGPGPHSEGPGPHSEGPGPHSEGPASPAFMSQEVADGRLSPEGQQQDFIEPADAVPSADLASTNCSKPGLVDPPEFGFEYLPESDQAEMLITDEELDAFLQAHSEAEQGVSYPESLPESNRAPEDRLVKQELRSCGHGISKDLEDLAFPESDQTMCVSVDGSINPGARSVSQDSCRPCQEDSSGVSHFSSNTFQSQHSSSPDLQPSYGGARPKQLHCQTARASLAGEEEEELVQTLSVSTTVPNTAEDGESSPETPSITDEHSNFRDSSLLYATQEHQDYSVGYDELSEPPPYPGEFPTDSARPVSWKREGMEELGNRQPAWVPDSEAPNCMKCNQKFTFTKRRHHCRACGKVYCAVCCNRKCKLKYLEKEARVCVLCFETIHRAQALERMMSPTGPSPNPNVPSEYCSTIPPLQQARAAGTLNSPPPTVMVPVSVLKHPNNDSCPREQKRVWFADGILPNGEVADTTKLSVMSRRSSQEFSAVTPDQSTPGSPGSETGVGSSSPEAAVAAEVVCPPVSGPWDFALLCGIGSSVNRIPSLLPDKEDELPPLLIATGEDGGGGDVLVEENPAPCQVLHLLEEGGPRPLTFILNANLLVNVKLVTYSGRECWCFGSNGLQALGQKELVFLLECLPQEKTVPKDLFTLYLSVYQDARKGKFLEELDNVTFTSSFLGSKDHAGMVFFSPTCQSLDGLTLPSQPFLFGLLIQKLEVPWAKVFPLRLLLRLGAEYNSYPTILTSIRCRDSVYRETGHTIMNLLADLRNYQYSLSAVEGLRIHMEMGHSYIEIPKGRFNEVQKVVSASNEHVISIGASFSSEADSHLVCYQNEERNYQTQVNSMPGKTRTVTGASFVVFNGALKASSGFIAKSSIVEDGLMVQIPPETMESLRSALREQTDFHIPCGRINDEQPRENVTVRWVDWSSPVNTGRTSGVDGRPLDGVHSVRMQQDTEFESNNRTIRCTEVFYQLKSPDSSLASVLSSCSVFQKEMALATCSALTPHLAVLTSSGINSLSLRVSTQADMVEYQAGSRGSLLPQRYMNEMDSALIPVIHGDSASVPQTAMDMEFTFYITHAIECACRP